MLFSIIISLCAPDSDPIVVIVAFCRTTLTGTKTFNLLAYQALSYGNTPGFQTFCRHSKAFTTACTVSSWLYSRAEERKWVKPHFYLILKVYMKRNQCFNILNIQHFKGPIPNV